MAPPGYLESTSNEPDEDMMDAWFDVSKPTKREVVGGRSPSFSFPSSARQYSTIDPRLADERGKERGSLEVLWEPRPSADMMLSSAAAWAVLRVELALGENADVGWREGRVEHRDAGLEWDCGRWRRAQCRTVKTDCWRSWREGHRWC